MTIDSSKLNKNIHHNSFLELIWTIIPAFILIIISLPAINLLNKIDDIYNPLLTLHIQGSQWFWSYHLKEFNVKFDSYTILDNIEKGDIRLLKTDNPLFLPILTPIRILLSSEDVIHSFALPNLGLKLDSNPGRINSSLLFLFNSGSYFGQCSEMCGLLHSKMAIEIIGVEKKEFILFILTHSNLNLPFFSFFSSFFL